MPVTNRDKYNRQIQTQLPTGINTIDKHKHSYQHGQIQSTNTNTVTNRDKYPKNDPSDIPKRTSFPLSTVSWVGKFGGILGQSTKNMWSSVILVTGPNNPGQGSRGWVLSAIGQSLGLINEFNFLTQSPTPAWLHWSLLLHMHNYAPYKLGRRKKCIFWSTTDKGYADWEAPLRCR